MQAHCVGVRNFGLFHSKPFSYALAHPVGPLVILYLDLETTGLTVASDRVVEIAATQAFERPDLPGACFSEVVSVPQIVLQTPGAQAAAAVHGISDAEIVLGPSFPESWRRFLDFTNSLLNIFVDTEDTDEEAAHNGYAGHRVEWIKIRSV